MNLSTLADQQEHYRQVRARLYRPAPRLVALPAPEPIPKPAPKLVAVDPEPAPPAPPAVKPRRKHIPKPKPNAIAAARTPRAQWQSIVQDVADKHGHGDIKAMMTLRQRKFTIARQEACYRLRVETHLSHGQLGNLLGLDPSTVASASKRYAKMNGLPAPSPQVTDPRKVLAQRRAAAVREMARLGLWQSRIARLLKIKPQTISLIARKNGIVVRPRPNGSQLQAAVRDLYARGFSPSEVAEKLGKTVSSIRVIASQIGASRGRTGDTYRFKRGVNIPDHLRDQYRYLVHNLRCTAEEACIELGLIPRPPLPQPSNSSYNPDQSRGNRS